MPNASAKRATQRGRMVNAIACTRADHAVPVNFWSTQRHASEIHAARAAYISPVKRHAIASDHKDRVISARWLCLILPFVRQLTAYRITACADARV